jgi:methylmalonyl-CoA/ethylmalonyl-CoA epimerase
MRGALYKAVKSTSTLTSTLTSTSTLISSFSTSTSKFNHWNLGRLNHVAIATLDLEKSTHFYEKVLGGSCSKPVDLPEHGVTTVFVDLGNTKVLRCLLCCL